MPAILSMRIPKAGNYWDFSIWTGSFHTLIGNQKNNRPHIPAHTQDRCMVAQVPVKGGLTPYALLGDWFAGLCILLLLISVIRLKIRANA
jgi:hypothetical protein